MTSERGFDFDSMDTKKLEWLLYLNAGMPEGEGLRDEDILYICRCIASREEEAGP